MEGSSSQASCWGVSFFRELGWEVLSPVLCWGMWAALEPGAWEPGSQHRQWVGQHCPGPSGRAETRPPEATGVPLLWVARPCGYVFTSSLCVHTPPSPGLAIVLGWFTLQCQPPPPSPPRDQQEPEEVAVAGVGPCGLCSGPGRFPGGAVAVGGRGAHPAGGSLSPGWLWWLLSRLALPLPSCHKVLLPGRSGVNRGSLASLSPPAAQPGGASLGRPPHLPAASRVWGL